MWANECVQNRAKLVVKKTASSVCQLPVGGRIYSGWSLRCRRLCSQLPAKNDEFCIEIDGFCIEIDGFCIEIDGFCIKNDELQESSDRDTPGEVAGGGCKQAGPQQASKFEEVRAYTH